MFSKVAKLTGISAWTYIHNSHGLYFIVPVLSNLLIQMNPSELIDQFGATWNHYTTYMWIQLFPISGRAEFVIKTHISLLSAVKIYWRRRGSWLSRRFPSSGICFPAPIFPQKLWRSLLNVSLAPLFGSPPSPVSIIWRHWNDDQRTWFLLAAGLWSVLWLLFCPGSFSSSTPLSTETVCYVGFIENTGDDRL